VRRFPRRPSRPTSYRNRGGGRRGELNRIWGSPGGRVGGGKQSQKKKGLG